MSANQPTRIQTLGERVTRPAIALGIVLGGLGVHEAVQYTKSSDILLSPAGKDKLHEARLGIDGLDAFHMLINSSDPFTMQIGAQQTVAIAPVKLGTTLARKQELDTSHLDPELSMMAAGNDLNEGYSLTPQAKDGHSQIVVGSSLNNLAGKFHTTYTFSNPNAHFFGDNQASQQEIEKFFQSPDTTLTEYASSQKSDIDGTYDLSIRFNGAHAHSTYTHSLLRGFVDLSGFDYSRPLPKTEEDVLFEVGE